ncbi:MAG: hypothetical protein WDW38_008378 [Sanguina aurantia]
MEDSQLQQQQLQEMEHQRRGQESLIARLESERQLKLKEQSDMTKHSLEQEELRRGWEEKLQGLEDQKHNLVRMLKQVQQSDALKASEGAAGGLTMTHGLHSSTPSHGDSMVQLPASMHRMLSSCNAAP